MKLLKTKIMMVFSVFALVGLLALSPALSNKASAFNNVDEFTWQLVVVSSTTACSNYHYQILNKYDVITEKYFELYQFANEKHDPNCFTLENYLDSYAPPDDLDMLILVLDEELGQPNYTKERWVVCMPILEPECLQTMQ